MEVCGTVVLKKGREASVKRLHPWIFSGAIQTLQGAPRDGEWVEVKDAFKNTLGFGHFQKGSITVRMLTTSPEPPGKSLYLEKIKSALKTRVTAGVVSKETNCYRLVHGEGDGLSGLIIDFYNGVCVMQSHSAGMYADRTLITESIKEALGENCHSLFYKSVDQEESAQNGYLYGDSQVPHNVIEHGHEFLINWVNGQKTGFFLDQRENRLLAGSMSKGARVLNAFCYSGGFSVYALKGGASIVHSLDASEKAIRMTEENLKCNGFDPAQHSCIVGDTFDYLKDNREAYDLIVLDPPAFAKHKDARHQAMKGYQRLNAEAMRVIKPGGVIFTFSCSQVVDRQLFYDTIVSAAIQTGREVKVLHRLSQPADHPVSMYHPEGEYLKGLVLSVN